MRKALLAVAAAATMIVPSTSQAANAKTFKILAPVTPAPTTDQVSAPTPCVQQGLGSEYHCQKAPYTRLARCLYLTDSSQAQDSTTGKIGWVFKVDLTKVRGDLNDDGDNKTFNLTVENALQKNIGGTPLDLPDVDIAFYVDLGVCASDLELPRDNTVPLLGAGPQTLQNSTKARGSYYGFGDEMNKRFPSGAYLPLANPNPENVQYANVVYAIVTLYGGTVPPDGATVKMQCNQCTDATWFKLA